MAALTADQAELRALLRARSVNDPYGATYRGTADTLIAAGIVESRHLPGIGCPRKAKATFYGDRLAPKGETPTALRDASGRMEVRRLPAKAGAPQRFEVFIYRDEEQEARKEYAALINRLRDPTSAPPVATAPAWPFPSVSPARWAALPQRVKRKLEALLAHYASDED